MKRITLRCTSPSLLLALVLFPPSYGECTDTILWTSRDGRTIHARLAGMDNSRVFLERYGQYHEVPFEVLSDASIAKARRLFNVTTASEVPKYFPTPASQTEPVTTGQTSNTQPTPMARVANHSLPSSGSTRVVRTTAYSCAEEDHVAYGSLNAVGTPLRYGAVLRSAAADWSVYPVGTTFRIQGHPWLYVIDDYGSALVGTGTIDLYQPNLAEMKCWGCRNVQITIVRWGCYQVSARILAPRIRHNHCSSMLVAIRSKLSGS